MASAQIDYVYIDYNVLLNGKKGILIHTGFDVQGLAGQAGLVSAYFNYWQGGPLSDFNAAYKTEDGHVGISVDIKPAYEETKYTDVSEVQLFMPYDELHMPPGISVALMCKVIVWDKSNIVPQALANSAWIRFNYSS